MGDINQKVSLEMGIEVMVWGDGLIYVAFFRKRWYQFLMY